MNSHRNGLTHARLVALSLVAVATLFACGKGAGPDPSTAAGAGSASASASNTGALAPSMDDTADDGSCAGANCLRRCDNKNRPLDCAAAGEALRGGLDEVTKDPAQAAKYFEKACGLKARDACKNLGQMLLTGEGALAADPDRAKILFQEACDLGSGATCDELAKKYEAGEKPIKKDHGKAVELWASACTAEAPEAGACATLIDLIAKKDKDAVRISEDWKARCKLKDSNACANAKKLEKK
jgi:TPR repeat protein